MNSNEDTPWEYKPDDKKGATTDRLDSSADSSIASSQVTKDIKPISWTASEYIDHARGAGWYLLLIIGTVVLAAGTYLLTKDYLAVAAITVVAIIVGVFAARKPRQVTYEITNAGIRVGEKFYDYSLFKSFAVVVDGALHSVNLLPLKRFMPPLSAYFDPKDEQRIVNALGAHLPYEEYKLDGIDRLTRRLRF